MYSSVRSLRPDRLPLQGPGQRKNVSSSTKVPSALGGFAHLTPTGGSAPWTPAGDSAPRPPLCACAPAVSIVAHPSAPPNFKLLPTPLWAPYTVTGLADFSEYHLLSRSMRCRRAVTRSPSVAKRRCNRPLTSALDMPVTGVPFIATISSPMPATVRRIGQFSVPVSRYDITKANIIPIGLLCNGLAHVFQKRPF